MEGCGQALRTEGLHEGMGPGPVNVAEVSKAHADKASQIPPGASSEQVGRVFIRRAARSLLVTEAKFRIWHEQLAGGENVMRRLAAHMRAEQSREKEWPRILGETYAGPCS